MSAVVSLHAVHVHVRGPVNEQVGVHPHVRGERIIRRHGEGTARRT